MRMMSASGQEKTGDLVHSSESSNYKGFHFQHLEKQVPAHKGKCFLPSMHVGANAFCGI